MQSPDVHVLTEITDKLSYSTTLDQVQVSEHTSACAARHLRCLGKGEGKGWEKRLEQRVGENGRGG